MERSFWERRMFRHSWTVLGRAIPFTVAPPIPSPPTGLPVDRRPALQLPFAPVFPILTSGRTSAARSAIQLRFVVYSGIVRRLAWFLLAVIVSLAGQHRSTCPPRGRW